ncbi:SRPBCC family protein [Rhodovulum euryhalinum]|uniref:Polyketide cyclase/dehydrase/lipid transport protein n=1 Tax=Rhodovulum euryhalinum TaxID=35805 RepID=A0A4R2KEH0_9RHOB|nr:SRPBCC family protein [Rhodovulum euryhalinum]TCO70597.1 polyketide cyclase/dehydrase/lipid transport protein [Rhodovulum euryhalinum]
MDHPTLDIPAPVRTAVRETILASRERIWHTLIDFERWPAWNAAFRRVELDGPLANGARVIWTSMHGLSFRTVIDDLVPCARIGWSGRSGTVRAGYVLTLDPRGGATLATLEASIESGLAQLIPDFTERALKAGLRRGLAALRRETERKPA